MKIVITRAGLIGVKGAIPVGAVIDWDEKEAQRLIERGFARAETPAPPQEAKAQETKPVQPASKVEARAPAPGHATQAKEPDKEPAYESTRVDIDTLFRQDPASMTNDQLLNELAAAGLPVMSNTSNAKLIKMVKDLRAESGNKS